MAACQKGLEPLLVQVSPIHHLCLPGIEMGDLLYEVKINPSSQTMPN